MSKEQLLQEVVEAFENLIAAAQDAAQRGMTRQADTWGPREIVAHLAGWEIIATVHIPKVAAGMSPLFVYADKTQQTVLNEALNATMVTLVAGQPLSTVCGLLRQAYQRDIEMLQQLDEPFFQPGEYVYERTRAVIEHCQEHIEGLVLSLALLYQGQGRYNEAEPLVKRALAICERALGPDHPHTQAVRHTYDELLQEMKGNP